MACRPYSPGRPPRRRLARTDDGLPGVLPRMLGEAGLEVVASRTLDGRMRFPTIADAVETAIAAGPLWGLFANRLDAAAQADVRAALAAHLEGLAEPDGDGVALPGEVAVVVGERPPA